MERPPVFALASYGTECHLYQLSAYATHASMIELLVTTPCTSCFVGLPPCSLDAMILPIEVLSFCACSRLVKLMDLQENDDFELRIASMESLSVMTEVIQFTSPLT